MAAGARAVWEAPAADALEMQGGAAWGTAYDPAAPAEPVAPAPPEADRLGPFGVARAPAPASAWERAAALLALGSAAGVLLFLLLSVGASRTPVGGADDFDAEPSLRVVAPGGWIALSGSDAPEPL